jgi:hypothetical protein
MSFQELFQGFFDDRIKADKEDYKDSEANKEQLCLGKELVRIACGIWFRQARPPYLDNASKKPLPLTSRLF